MNEYTFSPGQVHSVGAPITQIRLKHDYPDAPIRWEAGTVGSAAERLGTYGNNTSHVGRGSPATLLTRRPQRLVSNGVFYQDLRIPDRNTIPLYGSMPQYSFSNLVGTIKQAEYIPDRLVALPGGFKPAPGDILRGGSYPRVLRQTDPVNPPGGYADTVPLIPQRENDPSTAYAYGQNYIGRPGQRDLRREALGLFR